MHGEPVTNVNYTLRGEQWKQCAQTFFGFVLFQVPLDFLTNISVSHGLSLSRCQIQMREAVR